MYSKHGYCAGKGQHPRHHFKKKFKKMMEHKMAHRGGRRFPKVNVQELDDRYELFVYVAGYIKSDFKVDLTDNILIINAKPAKEDAENLNWRHQEFRPRPFERQFELNEKIDKDSISAKYEEGILKITLAKLEGMETISRVVDVD